MPRVSRKLQRSYRKSRKNIRSTRKRSVRKSLRNRKRSLRRQRGRGNDQKEFEKKLVDNMHQDFKDFIELIIEHYINDKKTYKDDNKQTHKIKDDIKDDLISRYMYQTDNITSNWIGHIISDFNDVVNKVIIKKLKAINKFKIHTDKDFIKVMRTTGLDNVTGWWWVCQLEDFKTHLTILRKCESQKGEGGKSIPRLEREFIITSKCSDINADFTQRVRELGLGATILGEFPIEDITRPDMTKLIMGEFKEKADFEGILNKLPLYFLDPIFVNKVGKFMEEKKIDWDIPVRYQNPSNGNGSNVNPETPETNEPNKNENVNETPGNETEHPGNEPGNTSNEPKTET